MKSLIAVPSRSGAPVAFIRSLLLVIAAPLVLVAPAAHAQVTLRLAHYNPESHAMHAASVQFATKVEERTKGQVKVSIFPNNTLGSPPEMLEQTKLGVIDMALHSGLGDIPVGQSTKRRLRRWPCPSRSMTSTTHGERWTGPC